MDWDDAFANAAYIADGAGYSDRWRRDAAAFRAAMAAAGRARLGIPYRPGARNRFDLFLPENAPVGLAMFIHGGFWLDFDKSDWSHFAAGALARGFAVALPSYTLCPAIRIAGIVREIAASIDVAAGMVDGPISLAGHSAGGHLVTRMACGAPLLGDAVRRRLRSVLSISGLHDLRPLLQTRMNATLKLDAEEAAAESPALLDQAADVRITCWVGTDERPEFRRQSKLLLAAWPSVALVEEPRRHHFDIIDGLAGPGHPLVASWLDEKYEILHDVLAKPLPGTLPTKLGGAIERAGSS